MSKHTPGPWKKVGLNWIGSDGSKVIISNGPAFGSKLHFPNAEANTRLIAAAPELLDLCKELLEAVPYVSEYDVPLGLWDDLRAVIAKATGGQQ